MTSAKWRQIHLSTLLVAAFTLAALLYLNLSPHNHDFGTEYGWPNRILTRFELLPATYGLNGYDQEPEFYYKYFWSISLEAYVQNIVANFGLLYMICFIAEWIARRSNPK